MKLLGNAGPDLRFEAMRPDGRRRVIMGDRLRGDAARFTATVLGVQPTDPQHRLLVVKNGVTVRSEPVTSATHTLRFSSTGPRALPPPTAARRRGGGTHHPNLARVLTICALDDPPHPKTPTPPRRRGGRMVVLTTIEDPAVIRRILTHLGLSSDPGEVEPSRAPEGTMTHSVLASRGLGVMRPA